MGVVGGPHEEVAPGLARGVGGVGRQRGRLREGALLPEGAVDLVRGDVDEAPHPRRAWSSTRVPITLEFTKGRPLWIERSTWLSAAKWTTWLTPLSPPASKAFATSSSRVMSPWTKV